MIIRCKQCHSPCYVVYSSGLIEWFCPHCEQIVDWNIDESVAPLPEGERD